MKKNKDEYIKFLEDKISLYENNNFINNNYELNSLIKNQEEYTSGRIYDREVLLNENKRLWDENTKLTQAVTLNNIYIKYLLSSFWWKVVSPFRSLWLSIKNIGKKNVIVDTNSIDNITDKVSVIIYSYNNSYEIQCQIDNIKKQKYVDDIEIIVVGRGCKKVSKKNVKYIDLGDSYITSDEAYIKVLPYIDGKYIAIIDQNKIINTNDWLYKSLVPIINNQALASLFLSDEIKLEKDFNKIKKNTYEIDNTLLLYLPINRDTVETIAPVILNKADIIVKKKISNYYLI